MVEKQASSEIAESRELSPSPVSFWDGQKYRFCPKCQQLAFEFAKAYGLEIWQAAERDTRERCAQDAKTIANLADEIYMSLRNFVDHAADCMYHRTDSPHGDVCVCRVQERCREIRAKVKQAHELAERIRGKE